jgi:hypothetical protein
MVTVAALRPDPPVDAAPRGPDPAVEAVGLHHRFGAVDVPCGVTLEVHRS